MQNFRKVIGIFALAGFIIGSVAVVVFVDGPKYNAPLESKSVVSTTSAQKETLNTTTETPKTTTTTPKPVQTPTSFTMAEVSTHNSSSSCWSAINGNVYDLTDWINSHPGGREAIKSICGRDGSNDFNEEHAGQKSPESVLASFKIGTLKR